MKHLSLPCIALLLTAITATAQKPDIPKLQFTYLNQRDGLTSNEINVITEDRDGFIWLATDDGLSRYDGHNFTSFRSSINRPDFLGSNTIRNIDILGDEIALVSPKGVEFMNRKSQKVIIPDLGELVDSRIKCLAHLNDHMLMFGCPKGLFEMNVNTSRIIQREYRGENGENLLTYVRTIFQDSSSNIWLGTWENGVFYIPCGSNMVRHLTDDDGIPDKISISGFAQGNDRLYISSWSNGIYILKGDQDAGGYSIWHITPEELGWTITYSIEVDDFGLVWVGTPTGVKVLAPEKGTLRPAVMASDDDRLNLERINEAKYVFKDSGGNMWISMNGHGAVVATRRDESVTKIDFNDMGQGFNEVTSIYSAPGGVLWLGIRGKGLVRFIPSKHTFREEDEFIRQINKEANAIVGFEPIPNKRFLIMAARYDGVYLVRLNGSGEISKMTHFDTRNNIRNNFTNCLCRTSIDNFWVGTNNGIVLLHSADTKKLDFKLFEPEDLNKAIGYGTVSSIMQAKNGELWIGTSDKGLFVARFDYFNMKMIECNKYDRLSKNFNDDNIQCIFQDSRSNIWVGTKSAGLLKYDPVGKTFERANKSSLFASDEISAICEDAKGDLWISTANGFLCYSADHEVKAVFPGSFYLPRAIWSDGKQVIIGGYTGLTFCNTNTAVRGFDIKSPRITNISVNNSEVSGLELMPPFTDKIVLQHSQRNITLTFSSPGLEREKMVRYAYRLAKPDKDWNYVSSGNRTVTYSNLASGKYTFSVMASSRPGVWSAPTDLEICIKRPLASSWLAILGYFIVVGVIYSYFRYMQRKQTKLTRDIDTFRRELAAQSAPNISTDLDKAFIDNMVRIIEDHLSDPDFNIDIFNAEMHMSGSTLYRRVKSLTGVSPIEFARRIRFKYACKFLMEKSSNVSEVAYMVGFSNAKYFSQSFKKEFGVTPSQYIKQHKK